MEIFSGFARLSSDQRRQTDVLSQIRDQLAEIHATQAETSESILRLLGTMNRRITDIRRVAEGIQIAMTQEAMLGAEQFYTEHVLDFAATLRWIADERMSFTRFGDGEFRAMLNSDYNLRFQINSPALQADLRRVLTFDGYDRGALMLGFPFLYRTPHWQKVWSDVWPRLSEILQRDLKYGCAHVSRPIAFRQLGLHAVELWRSIWDGRHVGVITGEGSRFTMHHALFDGVKSVEYFYSIPRDAYADIERLVETALKAEPELFLISLGPAGTVLAAELSRRGRWAIDIGHLSASYQQVFEGAVSPEHR